METRRGKYERGLRCIGMVVFAAIYNAALVADVLMYGLRSAAIMVIGCIACALAIKLQEGDQGGRKDENTEG